MVQSSSWAGSRFLAVHEDQRTEDTDSILGSAIYDTDNASLDHEDILLGSETFEERRPRDSVVLVEQQPQDVGVDQQQRERERSVTLDASSRQTTEEPEAQAQVDDPSPAPPPPLRSPYPPGTSANVQAHKRLPSVLKDLPPLTLPSEDGGDEMVLPPLPAAPDEDEEFEELSFWASGVHPHPEHYHECVRLVH